MIFKAADGAKEAERRLVAECEKGYRGEGHMVGMVRELRRRKGQESPIEAGSDEASEDQEESEEENDAEGKGAEGEEGDGGRGRRGGRGGR